MWRHASPLKLRSILLSRSSSAAAASGNAGAAGIPPSRQLHLFSLADKTNLTLPPRASFLIKEGNYSFPTPNSRFIVSVRCFSVNPQSTVDWNEPVSCSEVGDGVSCIESDSTDIDPNRPAIPVRAFFLSTSVDLKGLVDQNKQYFIPPSSRMTNYVVLKFGNLRTVPNELAPTLSGSDCTFVVAYHYGSVVLFNAPDPEVDGYLKIVEKHARGLLPEMRKDEYEVREKPELSTWMQAGLDHIMLQYLNVDGIRTIGSVLGQSIALDYYVRQVDWMVAEFTDINRAMEKTGTFTMKRKKLFQLVGKANSNLADVILKLGLFERSDIAWKDAKYAQIWEYLRDEFELTQRFASLDYKLKFVEHNIRFLQEILQNRRSDFLEWIIIILISLEIIITLYNMACGTTSLIPVTGDSTSLIPVTGDSTSLTPVTGDSTSPTPVTGDSA